MDNPAGRLLAALREGEQQPRQASAHKGWSTVWGLDIKTVEGRTECARRGQEMMALGIETRRQSEQLPVKLIGKNLDRLAQVQAALDHFPVLPTIGMQDMYAQIKPDGWLALENLDGLLSELQPEPVVLELDRKSLLNQTRELVDAVVADKTLDDDIKRQIIDQLRDVERSLIDVDLVGSAVVDKAANGLAGVMTRLWMRGAKVAKHPITDAVFKLVLALDVALNGAANYHELTTNPIILELISDPATTLALPPAAPDAVVDPD